MQQVICQDFYVPSDILDEVESEIEYQQEVSNMLATIMQTKRQMDVTAKEVISQNTHDQAMFNEYREKYPKFVEKVIAKFQKFSLDLSQLLRFIQIEQKFVNIKKQDRQNKKLKQLADETERKFDRKNLVQVHRMQMKKKPYQVNPRVFH